MQAAQCCHALAELYEEHPNIAKSWHTNSNYIILLATKSLESLQLLKKVAINRGVLYSAFHEPDLDDALTAIAFEPCEETAKLVSSLPLILRTGSSIGRACGTRPQGCGFDSHPVRQTMAG